MTTIKKVTNSKDPTICDSCGYVFDEIFIFSFGNIKHPVVRICRDCLVELQDQIEITLA